MMKFGWILVFLEGLSIDNNKNFTVNISGLFEEVDGSGSVTGPSFPVDYSFTDNELNVRNFTKKVTSADGFELGKYYQVSFERTSNTKLKESSLS